MEEKILENISQALNNLLDYLGIKETVTGINMKKILTDYLYPMVISDLDDEMLNKIDAFAKKAKSKLDKVTSDIISLHKAIIDMSPAERKVILYILLLYVTSFLSPNENIIERLWRTIEKSKRTPTK